MISGKVDVVKVNFFMMMTLSCSLSVANAGNHDFKLAQALPAYRQECASCHVAYPRALLPVDSWQRIMAGLTRHYGTDASLDADQVQTIGQWLKGQAGTFTKVRDVPPEDRISRSDWFVREHRGVAPEVWQLASVKSPAQCGACHTQADQGRFNERELRTPTGMNGGFR